jgi:hypothetical protein
MNIRHFAFSLPTSQGEREGRPYHTSTKRVVVGPCMVGATLAVALVFYVEEKD